MELLLLNSLLAFLIIITYLFAGFIVVDKFMGYLGRKKVKESYVATISGFLDVKELIISHINWAIIMWLILWWPITLCVFILYILIESLLLL